MCYNLLNCWNNTKGLFFSLEKRKVFFVFYDFETASPTGEQVLVQVGSMVVPIVGIVRVEPEGLVEAARVRGLNILGSISYVTVRV